MSKKKMDRRYSGPKSAKFWKRVNALPQSLKGEAYSLGVVLQNAESTILKMIELLECENEER